MGDKNQNIDKQLEILTKQKETLEKVIESIEDGFIETDLSGNITLCNPAFCKLIGYSKKESEGLSYREYMDDETVSNVYRTFNKVFKTRIPNKAFDYVITRKNRVKRNVEISITPIINNVDKVTGFRCVMRDVTDRKKIESELIRQKYHLDAIFSSVEDAIVTVDKKFNVIEANSAAHSICCISCETDKNFFKSKNSTCSLSCKEVLKECLTKKISIRDHRINCGNTAKPLQKVSLTCAPLTDQNDIFLGAVLVIRDVTRLSDLERELSKRHKFHNIIGKNHRMQEIYRLIEDISDFETTVLITGESGTGKELVARALHYSGSRSFKPFITVNCSALAENLLESELFGHVKGAFTGAVRDHIGRFQMADGGTLLLDEIGDISPLIQLKLLRVLQEKTFEKVGDGRPVRSDVRVIACTHQNLKEKVQRGEFREDLYYRLNVLEINLPPLRDRCDDLPLLIDHFIKEFETKFNTGVCGLSSQAMNTMISYNWPGNIRELENCLERAVILSKGESIENKHLALEINKLKHRAIEKYNNDNENESIVEALTRTGWNKAKAARILGISRKTLYHKIKNFNIPLSSPDKI